MRTNRRNLIYALIALLPTLFMFHILITLFPYTGLGRILVLPLVFILNAVLIISVIYLIRKLGPLCYTLVLLPFILLSIWNTIYFYPQEFSPSIPKQISYSISAINHYDDLTMVDWERYTFTANGNGDSERYAAALYKYKHRVPLDGSLYFYNDTDFHKDSPIKNLNGIPPELYPHHQFIWWLLKTLNK
ncbi:hypothetical protein [Paenibacillus kribbensis]|uniref:hypothetical protein n=1 Tax=Paenibacillus kribbensis TaxID=172713 RepID=UPI00211977FB|nr:hypothetical protein [Paenibacillus kribbensis]